MEQTGITKAGGGWGIRIAMAVVLVLLGIGIGWGVFSPSSPASSAANDPGACADGVAPDTKAPPRMLHSVGGLNGLLEQARKKFGNTTGYGLTIYPDYASLERTDPSDDRRKVSYYYRGGFEGSGSPSGTSSDDRVADLGKFDVPAIVGKLRGAPQILGIEPKDVKSTYVSIDPSKDATTPDAVDISIYVSTTYDKGGYIRVDPQGNVIGQYPPS